MWTGITSADAALELYLALSERLVHVMNPPITCGSRWTSLTHAAITKACM